MPNQTYYINMTGGGSNWKYAWNAKTEKYDNIAAGLGITATQPDEQGMVFGANNPKPAVIRLNLEDPNTNEAAGSQIVMCSDADFAAVKAGSLNGLTTNGKRITSASAIRG